MAISTHETRFVLSAKDKTKGALKSAKMNMQDVGKAVTGVHAKLLGLAGIGGFGALVSGIISTNREFQTLQSSLKTVTGSSENAAVAFEKIQKFAVTTPFDLNQWTEAFIKMKALGLDPSEAALNSYGNTAAAMGKSLNQMIEAVSDAATGEFERLKEFGIKARKQGESVTFTFQGVETTIKNNAQEITKYLRQIGDVNFSGAMAEQSKNLDAAFSNLGQAFQMVAVKIGEAGLNDLVRDLTLSMTEFVNGFGDAQLHTINNFFKGINDGFSSIAEVVSAITWLQGRGMLEQFERNNPSQVGNAGASIPGGYNLGDFNRSRGDIDALQRMRSAESLRDDKTVEAMRENNRFQAEILEAIKQQQNVAVAG